MIRSATICGAPRHPHDALPLAEFAFFALRIGSVPYPRLVLGSYPVDNFYAASPSAHPRAGSRHRIQRSKSSGADWPQIFATSCKFSIMHLHPARIFGCQVAHHAPCTSRE
eukprot:scaffold281197_cov33-Tisochrysis_lutea.AAC.2